MSITATSLTFTVFRFVQTHCKNIYKKLGIHKREELLMLMEHPSVAPEKDSEEEGAG
ncbi:MAG: helix-turn-helix transcriptional regulator [Slackia sp.]